MSHCTTHCGGGIKRFFQRLFFKRISRRLNLDAKQRERLDQLMQHWNSSSQAYKQFRVKGRNQLRSLLDTNTFDRDKANDMVQSHIDAMMDYSRMMVDGMAEFADSLEPHQRRQLQDYLDRRCCSPCCG